MGSGRKLVLASLVSLMLAFAFMIGIVPSQSAPEAVAANAGNGRVDMVDLLDAALNLKSEQVSGGIGIVSPSPNPPDGFTLVAPSDAQHVDLPLRVLAGSDAYPVRYGIDGALGSSSWLTGTPANLSDLADGPPWAAAMDLKALLAGQSTPSQTYTLYAFGAASMGGSPISFLFSDSAKMVLMKGDAPLFVDSDKNGLPDALGGLAPGETWLVNGSASVSARNVSVTNLDVTGSTVGIITPDKNVAITAPTLSALMAGGAVGADETAFLVAEIVPGAASDLTTSAQYLTSVLDETVGAESLASWANRVGSTVQPVAPNAALLPSWGFLNLIVVALNGSGVPRAIDLPSGLSLNVDLTGLAVPSGDMAVWEYPTSISYDANNLTFFANRIDDNTNTAWSLNAIRIPNLAGQGSDAFKNISVTDSSLLGVYASAMAVSSVTPSRVAATEEPSAAMIAGSFDSRASFSINLVDGSGTPKAIAPSGPVTSTAIPITIPGALSPGAYTVQVFASGSGINPDAAQLVDAVTVYQPQNTLTALAAPATVTQSQYTLTALVTPAANYGSISGAGTYAAGSTADLVATASTYYQFVYWTGDTAGITPSTLSSAIQVPMTSDRTLTAYFVWSRYSLTTAVSPPTGGSVSPVGTNTYAAGTSVSLLATAADHYSFGTWTGDVEGITGNVTDASIQVPMTGDKSLTANFVDNALNFSVEPAGSATITATLVSNGAAYASGTPVSSGTVVAVILAPNAGYALDHWAGDTTGVDLTNPLSFNVTLNEARTLTAYLNQLVILTTHVAPTGSGLVTPVSGSYVLGTSINLLASPLSNYVFDHWSGSDLTGITDIHAASATVQLNANRDLTANFVSGYTLTTSVVPVGGGTVTPSGNYLPNSSVTLGASPATGYTFLSWTQGANTYYTPSLTITMDGNKAFTAHFALTGQTVTLTTSVDPANAGSVAPASASFLAGAVQTISATPISPYVFANWSGDIGSADPSNPSISITMDRNRSLTAHFVLLSYPLTLGMSPDQAGTVSQSGSGMYQAGTTATVTAVAAPYYQFVNWTDGTGAVVSTDSVYAVLMDGPKSLTANFTLRTFSLTTAVTPANSGTVTPAGTSSYNAGTIQTVTASANIYFAFKDWTGDVTGITGNTTDSSIQVPMSGNKSLTANFEGIQLTYDWTPIDLGIVTATVNGLSYVSGTPCLAGTVVSLVAAANSGYVFSTWTGDMTGVVTPDLTHPESIQATVSSARTLTANFVPGFTLTTSVVPPGSGSISPLSGPYPLGSVLNVVASPSGYYTFANWTGDIGSANPSSPSISITVDRSRSLTANFVLPSYSLTLGVSPSQAGTVSQSGAGTYTAGTTATVTAVAAQNYRFVNWTDGVGTVLSTNAVYGVLMDGSKSLTANFVRVYTLTTAALPAGAGTVQPSGTNTYDVGDNVLVTATSSEPINYVFASWTGDVAAADATTNPLTVTMDQNKSLTANFVRVYTLTTAALPVGAGTVQPSGTNTYTVGYNVQVTATSSDPINYVFANWTGDVGAADATTNPLTVTMDQNRSLTANFVRLYTLTSSVAPLGTGTVSQSGTGTYRSGDTATLTAAVTDPTNYVFDKWTGDVGTADITSPSISIQMDGNKNLTANFVPLYSLASAVSPAGVANIAISPPPELVSGKYRQGTPVTLTASATDPTAYQFSQWAGDTGTANAGLASITITMDGNKSLTANFLQLFTVSVIQPPSAEGTVTFTPPDPVTGKYPAGFSVTLHAIVTDPMNYKFDHWIITAAKAGGPDLTSPDITIVVEGNETITPVFVPVYLLTAVAVPSDAGNITLNPLPELVSGKYAAGTPVTVTVAVTDATRYLFNQWSGDVGAADPTQLSITVTMDSDKNLVADFLSLYSLTTAALPTEGGTVDVSSPPNIAGKYLEGTELTITATPNEYYLFDHWSGTVAEADAQTNPLPVRMASDTDLTANFLPIELTFDVAPDGSGTIAATLASDNSEYVSGTLEPAGTVVDLVATANNSSLVFDHWSGDLSYVATHDPTHPERIEVTIETAQNLTANFVALYSLTAIASPSSLGSVSVSPPPDPVSGKYRQGIAVTLTATVNDPVTYTFDQWTGDFGVANPKASSITITMDANKALTANFILRMFALTTAASPAEAGSVTPAGSTNYLPGESVTVTATVTNAYYRFDKWSGDIGTANPAAQTIVIVMDASKNVTANFVKIQYALTTAVSPAGSGAVAVNPPAAATYDAGSIVTLTATASDKFVFDTWSGAVGAADPNSASISITMDGNKSLTANFVANTLTYGVTPSGAGTVSATPAGGAPQPSGISYSANTVVTLVATPSTGYHFGQWTGIQTADPTLSTITITMDGPKSVTASFVQTNYTLITSANPVAAGIVSPAGSNVYPAGVSVNLAATVTNNDYSFVSWTDATNTVVSTAPSFSTLMDGNKSLTANFVLVALAFNAVPANAGTVSATVGGNVYSAGSPLPVNSVVTLKANPQAYYAFDHWSGDTNGAVPDPVDPSTLQVTMDKPKSLTANFVLPSYTVTTTVAPANSGAVSQSGTGTYAAGASATLTATPASPDYSFVDWTGAVSVADRTKNPLTIVVDANKNLAANFVHIWSLGVSVSPPGTGTVDQNPPGTSFSDGTVINLAAKAGSSYAFYKWEGNIAPAQATTPSITVTMNSNVSLTADFLRLFSFTLVQPPAAEGTVSVSGAQPDPVTGNYFAGATVTLTATVTDPTKYKFQQWEITSDAKAGGPDLSSPVITITLNANTTVTPIFVPIYPLAVAVSPTAAGSVTLNPQPDPVSGKYASGTPVTVTVAATDATKYQFVQWSGDVGTADPKQLSITITMDGAKNLTADFLRLFGLITAAAPPAGGTVDVSAPPDVAGKYLETTTVTLTAKANDYYTFDHWSGSVGAADITINPLVVPMTSDQNLTANFAQIALTFGVTPANSGTIAATGADGATYVSGAPALEGAVVTLVAGANANFAFDHWSGGAFDTPDPAHPEVIQVTLESAQSLTANFVNIYTLVTAAAPATAGTVSPLGPGRYLAGQGVTITAIVTDTVNYGFDHWAGDVTGVANVTNSTITVVMNGNRNITGVFAHKPYTLQTSVDPAGAGTVNPAGRSTVAAGQSVNVSAVANPGYAFVSWTDSVGTVYPRTATITVTMDADKSLTAHFVQTFTLTTVVSPGGVGGVALSPAALSTVTPDSATTVSQYAVGATVTLTETLAGGSTNKYVFGQWTGDVPSGADATKSTIQVVMTANRTVTAQFAPIWSLTAAVSPANTGTINQTPSGTSFVDGTVVQLVAQANSLYTFGSWTSSETDIPAANLNNATLSVTMNKSRALKANFKQVSLVTLTVGAAPAGSGAVTAVPAGISYAVGSSVTLTAAPNNSAIYAFDSWSGDVVGISGKTTDATIVVPMTANKSLTANFVKKHYTLTTVILPLASSGAATASPTGSSYAANTQVVLTATPNSGWLFDHWAGDATGKTSPVTITMDAAKTVDAVFIAIRHLTITTFGQGSVLQAPNASSYEDGQSVTLLGFPASGWQFDHWEGSATGKTNPVTVTFNGADLNVSAVFTQVPANLTLALVAQPANGGTASPAGSYRQGQVVNLVATPNTGFVFQMWNGDAADIHSATTTTTMNASKTITAIFKQNKPVITSIVPVQDNLNKHIVAWFFGGGIVKINGSGFDQNAIVVVDGLAVTPIAITSTELTIVLPAAVTTFTGNEGVIHVPFFVKDGDFTSDTTTLDYYRYKVDTVNNTVTTAFTLNVASKAITTINIALGDNQLGAANGGADLQLPAPATPANVDNVYGLAVATLDPTEVFTDQISAGAPVSNAWNFAVHLYNPSQSKLTPDATAGVAYTEITNWTYARDTTTPPATLTFQVGNTPLKVGDVSNGIAMWSINTSYDLQSQIESLDSPVTTTYQSTLLASEVQPALTSAVGTQLETVSVRLYDLCAFALRVGYQLPASVTGGIALDPAVGNGAGLASGFTPVRIISPNGGLAWVTVAFDTYNSATPAASNYAKATFTDSAGNPFPVGQRPGQDEYSANVYTPKYVDQTIKSAVPVDIIIYLNNDLSTPMMVLPSAFQYEPVSPGPDWSLILTLAGLGAALIGLAAGGHHGGHGGPCFIATAAYGTPMAADIDSLRAFRDAYLLNSSAGTAFVDTYYRISPAIASVVAKSPVLAAGIRLILLPVIFLAKLLMAKPMMTVTIFALLVLAVKAKAWRRSPRRKRSKA